jgi:branched-chain amino acid aminotransferase
MIVCVWNKVTGWGVPELKPFGPFSIMPTASVLHYATECFEGMKVYRGYDGELRLFRPDQNCERMLISSERICLPPFEPTELEKLIKALVAIDAAKWLPKNRPGHFLYLRPGHIGSSAQLGLNAPKEAILFVVASCVPDLTQQGNGMKLLASKSDTIRAWPGGFGFAKVGANYGPSLIAHGEAVARGYDQILWLFGDTDMVTEAGASNFFVIWRTRDEIIQLITAPLEGKVILDGITRRSVLEFARNKLEPGYGDLERIDVVERSFYMKEVVEAAEEGRLIEAFAVGTAVSTSLK